MKHSYFQSLARLKAVVFFLVMARCVQMGFISGKGTLSLMGFLDPKWRARFIWFSVTWWLAPNSGLLLCRGALERLVYSVVGHALGFRVFPVRRHAPDMVFFPKWAR